MVSNQLNRASILHNAQRMVLHTGTAANISQNKNLDRGRTTSLKGTRAQITDAPANVRSQKKGYHAGQPKGKELGSKEVQGGVPLQKHGNRLHSDQKEG